MQQKRRRVRSAAEQNMLHAVALAAVLPAAHAFFLKPFLPGNAKILITIAVFLAVSFINYIVLGLVANINKFAFVIKISRFNFSISISKKLS